MKKDVKLQVENLTVSFWTNQGYVRAVRGVSFDLFEGETLAVVGESGSGKSVTSRAIMGILAGNAVIDNGKIIYEDQDLTKISEENFHKIRGDKIGMIFQDPLSSLNPIMRIGKQITEGVLINGKRLKNRYKKLLHRARMEVYNSKTAIADMKTELKENIKTIKSIDGLKDLTDDFNEQMRNIQERIDKGKRAIEKNEKVLKALKDARDEKTSLVKEYNENKAHLKVQHNKTERKVERVKRIAKLKAELKEKMPTAIERKKQAISNYKKQKVEAKKTVRKEWADEKARYEKEAQKVRENLKTASDDKKQALKQELSDLKESLRRYKKVTKKEALERAYKVMDEVGIPEPKKRVKQYPFQFSGGMRQRIVIAIALTADPDLLICDEPTTALDVTIQAQILELINKLKSERSLSVIFITHDLGVVANMADRVAVMYAGKIVEIGTADEIYYNPKHPYTWALMSSVPDLTTHERLASIPGTPPNMLYPPKGDAFADRSSYAMKIDFEKEPPMFKISDTHYAATWLLHEHAPKVEMPEIIKKRIEVMTKKDSKEVSR